MEIPSVSQDFQLSVGVRKREDFQVTVSVLVCTARRTKLLWTELKKALSGVEWSGKARN